MKKTNVVLQVAVAGALLAMFGSANAQSAITQAAAAPKFALEVFKGSAAVTSVALNTPLTVVSGAAIPANSNVSIVLQLGAGATFDTTVGAAAVVGGAVGVTVNYANSGGATLIPSVAGTTASNADTVIIGITSNTTAVGLGGNLATVSGLKIHAASLATAGTITTTSTLYTGALTALPTAGTTALDATSPAVTIATSAQGITLAAAATTAGTQKIDLAVTPAGSLLTGGTTTVATLGTVKATATASALTGTGAAYTTASKMLTATVTAPAGFFAAMGNTANAAVATPTKAWLEANACTAGAGSALAGTPTIVFATSAAASAATTLTLTSTAAPVSGTAYNVCMEIDGKTAMIEGTPTVALSLGAAATQDSAQSLAASGLMALSYNGSLVDVINYVPAAVAGFTNIVRVVNTGSVADRYQGFRYFGTYSVYFKQVLHGHIGSALVFLEPLALRLNFHLPAGKAAGKPDVLAFAAYGHGKLVV